MKIINLQCPNCGGKLTKAEDDLLECESCHSQFLIQDEAPDYYVVNNFYTHSAPIKTKRQPWQSMLFFSLAVGMVVFFVIAFVRSNFVDSPASSAKPVLVERDRPESAAGIALAERIFHKPLEQITTEELAQLKYLSVQKNSSNEEWQILYGLTPWQADTDDYEAQELTIPGTKKMETLDFTAFKGLQFLDLMNTSEFSKGEEAFSLAGLEELLYYGHDFNQPLEEILTGLPNPKQLKYLRTQLRSNNEIQHLAEATNLKGLTITFLAEDAEPDLLKELAQLQQLELSMARRQDVSWLAAMSGLKQVTLTEAAEIEDYSVFFGMPQLTVLSLQQADQLKELRFVQNLPNLKRLEIAGSKILTLEPLQNKETLGIVHLEKNAALTDVSALQSLPNLTELTLDSAADSVATASLADLAFLKEATLHPDYLEMLADSPSVQSLELRAFFDIDLKEVAQLPNLERLTIYGTNSQLENEENLQQLKQLKHLALYDTDTLFASTQGSCIFRLPQLSSLVLGEDSNMKVNLDTGIQLDGLEYFALKNDADLTVIKDGTAYTREDTGLDVLAESLTNAPRLTQLQLPECKLRSLEFARSLNQLKLLDVQDNYITDVSPLSQLSQLQEVNLAKNPVTNQEILSDHLYIVN